MTKFKAFAGNNLKGCLDITSENSVRKGENDGHQHFSPFATMFS